MCQLIMSPIVVVTVQLVHALVDFGYWLTSNLSPHFNRGVVGEGATSEALIGGPSISEYGVKLNMRSLQTRGSIALLVFNLAK